MAWVLLHALRSLMPDQLPLVLIKQWQSGQNASSVYNFNLEFNAPKKYLAMRCAKVSGCGLISSTWLGL